MTNLDNIFKADITLPTKVHLVKAMVFTVVMYRCECCTIKKDECWKNWCFWTVVLQKTLESPLDCKDIEPVYLKGNQSWIFIGLMLKLKLQYFAHLMRRTDSLEKTLMLGKMKAGGERDNRGWGGWMTSLTQWTQVWVNSGSWWWTGCAAVHGFTESGTIEQLKWTELNWLRN